MTGETHTEDESSVKPTTNETDEGLYWSGGPFRVGISHSLGQKPDAINDAVRHLEEFRSECQMHYMAFNGVVGGRAAALELYRRRFSTENRDAKFFVGTQFPDDEQSPGSSTIAQMTQGDFLEALTAGGTFERLQANAFIVLVYALWDENYRRKVADAFGVAKGAIACDLMGEIRHVRTWIVHDNSVAPPDLRVKCPMLTRMWKFEPGELAVTDGMLHSLMEQINALRIELVRGE